MLTKRADYIKLGRLLERKKKQQQQTVCVAEGENGGSCIYWSARIARLRSLHTLILVLHQLPLRVKLRSTGTLLSCVCPAVLQPLSPVSLPWSCTYTTGISVPPTAPSPAPASIQTKRFGAPRCPTAPVG